MIDIDQAVGYMNLNFTWKIKGPQMAKTLLSKVVTFALTNIEAFRRVVYLRKCGTGLRVD